MSSYHYSKQLNVSFEEAVEEVKKILREEGFGILSEIDIKKTLYEKLGMEFRNYLILGACNPGYAYKALSAEEHIGLMLPCNVIVHENKAGNVEVSAVDPIASMQAVENERLRSVALAVQDLLRKVINRL